MISDTLGRRETNFGGAAGVSSSATLGRSDPLTLANAERDYALPGGDAHLAMARIGGLAGLTASSSGSDPQSFLDTDQAAMPFSAVDGDLATAWRSSPGATGLGQWLQLELRPADRRRRQPPSSSRGQPGHPVTVTTDQGEPDDRGRRHRNDSAGPPAGRHPRAAGDRVRAGPGVAGFQQVGFAELAVPGVQPSRTIVLPDDLPERSRHPRPSS